MKATYHLPGLFEFYELYRLFLPLYRSRREYFYAPSTARRPTASGAGAGWALGRTGPRTQRR